MVELKFFFPTKIFLLFIVRKSQNVFAIEPAYQLQFQVSVDVCVVYDVLVRSVYVLVSAVPYGAMDCFLQFQFSGVFDVGSGRFIHDCGWRRLVEFDEDGWR